jgi:hypothetical protein
VGGVEGKGGGEGQGGEMAQTMYAHMNKQINKPKKKRKKEILTDTTL